MRAVRQPQWSVGGHGHDAHAMPVTDAMQVGVRFGGSLRQGHALPWAAQVNTDSDPAHSWVEPWQGQCHPAPTAEDSVLAL